MDNLADVPAFLTIRQFMKLTGASRSHAYRLVRQGQIDAIRLGKRRGLRISRNNFFRFCEARAVKGNAVGDIATGPSA